MEKQYLFIICTDKVFSFLSQDEVEKLKQEEEKKIATLTRDELKSWAQIDENEGLDDDDPTEDQDNRRPKYVFVKMNKLYHYCSMLGLIYFFYFNFAVVA